MSNPALIEFIKQERYPKIEKTAFDELDKVLLDLQSSDISLRERGAKKLSWHARRELGWICHPVRVWFFNEKNRTPLFEAIKNERDEKLQVDLLHTLIFFYERYILHMIWENEDKEPCLLFAEDLKNLAEFASSSTSPYILGEAAYILAMLGDSRSWGIYNAITPMRTGLLGWFEFAYFKYGKLSMTQPQAAKLITTLTGILEKTKNRSVEKKAKSAIRYCKPIAEKVEEPIP